MRIGRGPGTPISKRQAAIIFYGGGILIFIVGLVLLAAWLPMLSYPSTQGKVISSQLSEKHVVSASSSHGSVRTKEVYVPMIEYVFDVGGTQFTGFIYRKSFDHSNAFFQKHGEYGSLRWAQEVVDKFPPGATLTVYYDPRMPGNCVLSRSVPRFPVLLMGISVLFLLVVRYGIRKASFRTR